MLLAAPIPWALAILGLTPWATGRDLVAAGAWWHAAWIGWFYLAPVLLTAAWWGRRRLAERAAAVLWCGTVLLHLLVVVAVAVRFASWATPAVWLVVAVQLGVGLAALATGVHAGSSGVPRRALPRGFR